MPYVMFRVDSENPVPSSSQSFMYMVNNQSSALLSRTMNTYPSNERNIRNTAEGNKRLQLVRQEFPVSPRLPCKIQ